MRSNSVNPVRNTSPAIAGLETERGIISNRVNIIIPFTSRTRDSYHTQFYNRNDGAFIRVSVFGKEEHLKEANSLAKLFAEKVLDLLPDYWPIEK
jgi:hypothetical protein